MRTAACPLQKMQMAVQGCFSTYCTAAGEKAVGHHAIQTAYAAKGHGGNLSSPAVLARAMPKLADKPEQIIRET